MLILIICTVRSCVLTSILATPFSLCHLDFRASRFVLYMQIQWYMYVVVSTFIDSRYLSLSIVFAG